MGYEMARSRMSLDWLTGYELRRGWRGPSPNIVVAVVVTLYTCYTLTHRSPPSCLAPRRPPLPLPPPRPPRQYQPMQECLGWVLMQQGKLKQAEQVVGQGGGPGTLTVCACS